MGKRREGGGDQPLETSGGRRGRERDREAEKEEEGRDCLLRGEARSTCAQRLSSSEP